MGKKRRYRKYPQKFGMKYGLKYGLDDNAEYTPEPAIMAAPEPIVEEPVVIAPEPVKITATADPIVEVPESAPKKNIGSKAKATTKKKTTTVRKTTRKRTTKAKTTT